MHYLTKLVKTIQNSREIVIATHRDPDGDGIAAALASAYLVKHYHRKKPTLFCHSRIPVKYHFLLGNWKFTRRLGDFDLLIAVDSAGISRIFPSLPERQLANKSIINIDHHRSNNSFGALRIIDEQASSACEIIYFIFKRLKIRIPKQLADIFYCGIYNETGGFVYPNTTKESLLIASELVGLGVQPDHLVKQMNAKTLSGTTLLTKVLSTIEVKHGVAMMYLCQDMLQRSSAEMSDSENFISFLQAIKGVRVSMFLREEKDSTRISLRSDGIIDVDKLARQYGGGGHRLAAGLRIRKDIHAAKKEILNTILREIKKQP
ncbi:MAG: bifunctional oligoribonuclease/PAP phosphatase NrnA [candidate division WOR-3 bacterium]|nr:MAG: bifunctional oligoribonuclease/PAP phosphatase NrnA [candidate division WOR-3 bacterium]